MVRCLAWIALVCGCKAQLGEVEHNATADAPGSSGDDGAAIDARIDAQPDAPDGPWGTPAVIPNTAAATVNVDDPVMTQDGLDIIYAVTNAAGTAKTLFEIQRTTTSSAWGAPASRDELNIGASEESPRLTADDKTIYYGVAGTIYTATRTGAGQPFGTPTVVGAINVAGAYQKWMAICDGDNVMVSRANPSTAAPDLYEGTLTDGAPTDAATLNEATTSEISTYLSKDCLTVYYASNRGTGGTTQLYTSTRPTIGGAWAAPVNVASPFSENDGTDNEDPWLSNDGHFFVFAGIRGGATVKQLYISTR